MKRIILTLALTSALTGCASGFHTIDPVDGGYVLTKDTSNIIRSHGEMWACEVMHPKRMKCRQLATD